MGALLAIATLTVNARSNLRAKSIDIVARCAERFDAIRSNADGQIKIAGSVYHRQFWGLQNDQFDFWLGGFADPETMGAWAHSVTTKLKKRTYQISWKLYKRDYGSSDPSFSRFVNKLMEIKPTSSTMYLDILDALIEVERYEEDFILMHRGRLGRHFLSHASMAKYKTIYIEAETKAAAREKAAAEESAREAALKAVVAPGTTQP
ncbi:MAG: hypothetical protein EOP60_14185 [Sphingomonadales bacterium]|nr:MAG: hypothetical protein EOP60_14185 [Sphingomonadales bacterium]